MEIRVSPQGTCYKFKYVKVSGWYGKVNIDEFIGCVVYSDFELAEYIS